MRAGLDQQADAHDVAQREPPLERPIRDGSHDATHRHGGREEAKSHGVHAESLARVEHEYGPGSPERDVEGQDRQRERAHRRVRQEPAEAFGDLGADAFPLP